MSNYYDDVYSKREVRENTDRLTSEIDKQAMMNIEINMKKRDYREELENSIRKLDNHSICPDKLPTSCDGMNSSSCNQNNFVQKHGSDCQCSQCVPRINANWFKKNRLVLLLGVLWVSIIILAVGWSPSGETFQEIQQSYVELLVDFFKVAIMVVAAIVTVKIAKNDKK